MLLLSDLIFNETGLLQIDLVCQLQTTRFADHPHRAAGRRERRDNLVEHRVVEIDRRDIAARKFGDFLDEPLDLALRALDLIGIDGAGTFAAGNLGIFGSAHAGLNR